MTEQEVQNMKDRAVFLQEHLDLLRKEYLKAKRHTEEQLLFLQNDCPHTEMESVNDGYGERCNICGSTWMRKGLIP